MSRRKLSDLPPNVLCWPNDWPPESRVSFAPRLPPAPEESSTPPAPLTPAGSGSIPAATPPAPASGASFSAADRLAEALADHALADRLLALPRAQRLADPERNPGTRRLSLARLLLLRAEAALEDDPAASEAAAELAAAIAAHLHRDPAGQVARAGAMAAWLLGKALLRAAEPPAPVTAAAEAFASIAAHLPSGEPSRERALAAVGLAQLRWRQGLLPDAGAQLAQAAHLFARIEAPQQVAACQVQHGLLLLGAGDRLLARLELAKAQRLLDPWLAPTLATLTALGLAACETTAGNLATAVAQLARGRAYWRCAPAPPPALAVELPPDWLRLLSPQEEPSPLPPPQPAPAIPPSCLAPLTDHVFLGLLAAPPWRDSYPAVLVALADRLLLGRAEKEPPLGLPEAL